MESESPVENFDGRGYGDEEGDEGKDHAGIGGLARYEQMVAPRRESQGRRWPARKKPQRNSRRRACARNKL